MLAFGAVMLERETRSCASSDFVSHSSFISDWQLRDAHSTNTGNLLILLKPYWILLCSFVSL